MDRCLMGPDFCRDDNAFDDLASDTCRAHTLSRHNIEQTMKSITVTARWDPESRTWWTDGDDVPGLCCEGRSFEELSETVFAMAPDLLVENGAASMGEQVEIVLIAEQRKTVAAAAA